jgi:hypothetical protein
MRPRRRPAVPLRTLAFPPAPGDPVAPVPAAPVPAALMPAALLPAAPVPAALAALAGVR